MTAAEWLALIGGLVFGYLVVAALIRPRAKRPPPPVIDEPARTDREERPK